MSVTAVNITSYIEKAAGLPVMAVGLYDVSDLAHKAKLS